VVPWGDARVACVWPPHLPLRLEVVRRPDLDGRPLVLGAAPGQRRVVQLCSPEAEQAGLRVGLPLREVAPLCPDAVVVQPDPAPVGAARDSRGPDDFSRARRRCRFRRVPIRHGGGTVC